MDNPKLKNEILMLLDALSCSDFYPIGQHFTKIDHYILKEVLRDLSNNKYIEYNKLAWEQNQLLVKITVLGRQSIRIKNQNINEYKKRTWLMTLGVISSVAFGVFLAFGLFYYGLSSNTPFRAELLSKDAYLAVQDYFKEAGFLISNYEITLIEDLPELKKYEIKCVLLEGCSFTKQELIVVFKHGEWIIED